MRLNDRNFHPLQIQATPVVSSNSNEETDKKLAAWLKRILPALEKELELGPTPVYENGAGEAQRTLQIEEYQDIELKKYFSDIKNFSDDDLNKGAESFLLLHQPADAARRHLQSDLSRATTAQVHNLIAPSLRS